MHQCLWGQPMFVQILDRTLLPFIEEVFPSGHGFMQDNDPKHTSTLGKDDHGVNWCHTPPESPDLNPIENLWHELKGVHQKRNKAKDEG